MTGSKKNTPAHLRNRKIRSERTAPHRAPDHTSWIRKFETDRNGRSLQALRQTAIADFDRLGYPTTADEAWKSVNLSALIASDFQIGTAVPLDDAELQPFIYPDMQGIRLVFVNGHYAPEHGSVSDLPDGITISNLADVDDHPCVRDHLGKLAHTKDLAFTALNTAFMRDGVFIRVPPNVAVEFPVHILFVTTASDTPTISHPRSLILAEENSQLSLVETHAGIGTGTYFANAVTEIIARDKASVNHIRLGLQGIGGVHVANFQAQLGRSSRMTFCDFTLGGAFVRHDVSAHLRGERGEATVNGLYVLDGSQLVDNYTLLQHAEPHCPSHELYKGILGGSARAIFRGKIHVHQKAQHTDAYQQNENILLSNNARVNTKPQLEIYADEVKCSHGATIGQLDENALFYFQARGIPKAEATRILLRAYADDIVGRVPLAPVRSHLSELIDARLEHIYAKDMA